MGLSRRNLGMENIFEKKNIDVWEIATKKIIFTGDSNDVCMFLNMDTRNVATAVKRKSKIKKGKYTLRVSKINNL